MDGKSTPPSQLPPELKAFADSLIQKYTQVYTVQVQDAVQDFGYKSDSEFELDNSIWANLLIQCAEQVERVLIGAPGDEKKGAVFAMLDEVAAHTKTQYDSPLLELLLGSIIGATKGLIKINIPKGSIKKCLAKIACCCRQKKKKA